MNYEFALQIIAGPEHFEASKERERETMSSEKGGGVILVTLRSLFTLDNATRIASVELWVLLTTVLLVWRFVLDFSGPWFGKPSRMFQVLTLEILTQNLVIYTIGLMQLSGARVNDYFQVWAVLLVTLQYSVKIGRPYSRSKQIPLLDLMSSFWAANLLRVQTFYLLRIPLWLIWSLNVVRIIVLFVTSGKAETHSQESMRLVNDYMSYEDRLPPAADLAVSSMSGRKYLVHGEHRVLKEVQEGRRREGSCFRRKRVTKQAGRSYKIELKPDGDHSNHFVTVEKIWSHTSGSGLLGAAADPRGERKDLCLSFALYKLLRRRFFDLPVHEATRPRGKDKIRELVFGYILADCERAFRITGVELSFLQDLFHSKHATVFAGGLMVPLRSLLLSLAMAAATGYIAYTARYIPERMDPADRNRITHGVFVTRVMVGIIILKELLEIFLYVSSRWAKVLLLCKYAQHHQCWRHPVVERAMTLVLFLGRKAEWSQQTIGQQNLLVTFHVPRPGVPPLFTWTKVLRRGVATGTTTLEDHTKTAILDSLRNLKDGQLGSYFSNAFESNKRVKWPSNLKLKADTHIILVWHIATGLCEISFFSEVKGLTAVRRPRPFVVDSAWSRHYATAASLSNYCAYLVRKALVPDNPIVAGMVLDEVIKELDYVVSKSSTMELEGVYHRLMKIVPKPCKDHDQSWSWGPDDVEAATPMEVDQADRRKGYKDLHIGCSITRMGAVLGKHLTEAYEGDAAGLWRDLASFWTGFLLHLAVNTRAVMHGRHLAGDSELITHLWALLSHACFSGNAVHGEEGPDLEGVPNFDTVVNQQAT
ncbi:hypothetical protein VPH35_069226 [Triticum aestivum]|uniref:DUF4220 domain-containing protein n=3 Tax=Triticum TaxID=4564 RepID=A0A9R0W442_TRITD|nr:unnamed protein product [Triticum turgidum subsp. durum]